ncbi:unnamed protein product [marine sediment metagenome]|uniref:Uncharacterized protein n=1 Tax=marine sediment metagenome TaxID=412755 RepID=X1IEU9_9ZZZZ
MDKSWWKSKTAWGGVLAGGGIVLSSTGAFLSEEIDAWTALMGVISGVGIILVAVGLRSAVAVANSKKK